MQVDMKFDEWTEKYKPINNPNAQDENSPDLFETYGDDHERVLQQHKIDPKTIWTLLDNDEGDLVVSAGYHVCNRVNYFITEVPWEDSGLEIPYCDEVNL